MKKYLLISVLLYILAQTATWFQMYGQFFIRWIKDHPWLMAIFGVPIALLYIYATRYGYTALGESAWGVRFISFTVGIFVYTAGNYYLLNEPITMKVAASLVLSIAIICIQIWWK